ncbi:hypothetical protein [Agrococcus sp. ProA11]|uniref:hypothetical protein n=1 Tax=Agrococcus chionoecetis TaxID=3153752 RepID=UPI00326054F8
MTSLAARTFASLTPQAVPSDPVALERLRRERLRSSIGWLTGGVAAAHLAGLLTLWAAQPVGGWMWFGLTALLAAAMLAAGFAQLVLLMRAEQRGIPAAVTIGAVATLGVLTAPLAGFLLFVAGVFQLVAPVAAMAFGIGLLACDPSMRAGVRRPWTGAASGFVVVMLAIAAGVLDTLVLLPLAMAPGRSLTEISAALTSAGEGGGMWVPLAWATLWLAAAALLALGLLRNRRTQRGALGVMLGAATAALFALPIAQFPIGMSMGDTFVTQGGGASALFPALIFVASLCAALASALLIGSMRR